MRPKDRTVIEINGFRLDPYKRLLLDRQGAAVKLTAKAFDAVVFLVGCRGTIVERSELMAALWPNRVVDDNNLNQVITAIRRALGDDCIETIKGRGYQFVAETYEAPVESTGRPPTSPANGVRTSQRLTAVAILLTVATVAVIVINGRPESKPPFDLVQRYSEPPDVAELPLNLYQSARDLEIRSNSTTDLWEARDRYERAIELEPHFALAYARLALNYLEEFALVFPQNRQLLEMGRATAEKAVEMDPDLADAQLAFGWSHFHGNNLSAALTALTRANELNPDDPETRWMIGMTWTGLGDWNKALTEFEAAHDLISTHRRLAMTEAIAYANLSLREYDEAEKALADVLALSPDSAYAMSMRAMIAMLRHGDVTLARERAGQTFQGARAWLVEPPEYFAFQTALYSSNFAWGLSRLDEWSGTHWHNYQMMPKPSAIATLLELADQPGLAAVQWEAANAALREDAMRPSADPALRIAYAETLAALGHRAEARRVADEVLDFVGKIAREGSPGIQFVRLDAALRIYVRINDIEKAAELLDAYFSHPGWWSIEGLWPDPRLDRVRERPELVDLFNRHRRK